MLNDSKSPILLTTSVVGLTIAVFGLYVGATFSASFFVILLAFAYFMIASAVQLLDYMDPIGSLSHKASLASIENNHD